MRYHIPLCIALLAWSACAPADDTQATATNTPGAQQPGAQQPGAQPDRQVGATATAAFFDRDGQQIGNATLEEGPEGVFVRGELSRLTPGGHGFHFHQVGECEPPFQSAGDHFNPTGRQHGLLNAAGAHAGDMANVHADANGNARIEALAPGVTLRGGPNALLDGDGTSIVLHAGEDDHRTDPSGNSGDRIACAVVR
jgi:superoxide dismutase, Cu-Zn family